MLENYTNLPHPRNWVALKSMPFEAPKRRLPTEKNPELWRLALRGHCSAKGFTAMTPEAMDAILSNRPQWFVQRCLTS